MVRRSQANLPIVSGSISSERPLNIYEEWRNAGSSRCRASRSLKNEAVCLRHKGHGGCTAKKFDKRLSCKADRVRLNFRSPARRRSFEQNSERLFSTTSILMGRLSFFRSAAYRGRCAALSSKFSRAAKWPIQCSKGFALAFTEVTDVFYRQS